MNRERFIYLDLIRGIAALLVFYGHLRAIYFMGYPFQNHKGSALKSFYFITGFGHEAVMIFFVLSGFFIAKTINNSIKANNWSFSSYIFSRFVRLWDVLIPAIVLGAIFDNLTLFFFPESNIVLGKILYMPDIMPQDKTTVSIAIANIFFLQGILSPTYGSNGALWSLANEFWYYMLFPLLLFTVKKDYQFKKRLLLALFALIISYFIGKTFFLYFLVWLFGVIVFYLSPFRVKFCRFWLIISLVSTIFILTQIRLANFPIYFNDFTLGISFAVFVFFITKLKKTPGRFLSKLSEFLSNISYTLYLIHLPALVFICSFFDLTLKQFSCTNLLYYIALSFVIIVYAYVIWYIFERNTSKIKILILSGISKSIKIS
ncbi:MAG: acyltransferase [Saprospiraceae bacterium]|nr:acyltransferase [Saprospiraceae bacterium]